MRANKIVVYCIMIMMPVLLLGQSRISGKITDGIQPLTSVNIVVLKTDSGYVAGSVTDSTGSYVIENLKYDKYKVLVSMTGYVKKVVEIVLDKENISLPDIIIEPEAFQMKEVVVSTKRNAFKAEPGKTIVDLSAVSLGSNGSLLNTLGKIPGILILNDGTVLLNGQAGANVMIDDKITYLSGENLVNMLRSIPSSAVEKIEMVTQPSARYDAGGTSGFINIKRKKKVDSGVNVVLSSNVESGKYLRQNQNVSFRMQHKKYSFYTDYSFYKGHDFIEIESFRDYYNIENFDNNGVRIDMQAYRKFYSSSNYFKTGIEYEFSKKMTIGTYVNGNWFRRSKNENVQSDFITGNYSNEASIATNNIQNVDRSTLERGLNLSYKFTQKLKWENSLSMLDFKQKEELDQVSNSSELSSKSNLKGKMEGNIQVVNFQSDADYKISDRFTFLSGFKSSIVTIDNNALYKSLESGKWEQDEKLSSGFIYRESILAGYLQLSQKWSSRFSAEAGLRYEHTGAKSNFESGIDEAEITRLYGYLFPSLRASYSFTEENTVSLQYGRRIVRPNYRDLNPFTEVNDRYLQEKGNTALNPELVNNLEGSWFIKSRYVFSLFYSIRKNPIAKSYLTETDSEVTIVMPLNLKESHAFGLRININNIKPVEYWTVQFNSSFTYKQFHWFETGKLYSNNLLTPTMQISNQFTLPGEWAVEAVGFFNGKMAEGQVEIGSFGAASLGVRKSFFEKKLNLYLYVNDIFLSNRQQISLSNSVISGKYQERRDSRMIGITATWRFNSGDLSKSIRKAGEIEENNRINL